MVRSVGKDPYAYALTGGEDYELVLTMAPDDFYLLKEEFSSLTVIEGFKRGSGNVYLKDGHHTQVLAPSGWNHFSGGE